jgi:hypothetical protein
VVGLSTAIGVAQAVGIGLFTAGCIVKTQCSRDATQREGGAAVLPLRGWSGSDRLVDSLPTPDSTIYKRMRVVGPYRLRELLLNPLGLCTLGQQKLGLHA